MRQGAGRRLAAISAWLARPAGRAGTIALIVLILAAPSWLFADSLASYRLHSDDFAYIAASRTLGRAVSNLFVPHNTHIVPTWRLITWAVSASAGSLAGLQTVMARTAFGIVVATTLLLGGIVARETGRLGLAVGAMTFVGTTSVLRSSVTWYSAGQTYWAAFGILGTIAFLQGYRRRGGSWRLVLAALSAAAAGGCWTIGHAAGPVGAVYLWADGRRCLRKAAVVPLLATVLMAGGGLAVGASRINATISFHGRTSKQALSFTNGAKHTIQSIPEDLILGNLGFEAVTTFGQGCVLSAVVVGLWVRSQRGGRRAGPLEWAGATLTLLAYFVEWSFRGYLPFSSLRGVVPWYDTIPQIGAILFAAGWTGRRGEGLPTRIEPMTRLGALVILGLTMGLVAANQGRSDALMIRGVPGPSGRERRVFVTPRLLRLRAVYLAHALADQQRRHFAQLDRSEIVARRAGIGREAILRAFGKVPAPEIPDVYDAGAMLALPWKGTENDPARVRAILGPYFEMEPGPRVPDTMLGTARP